MIGLASPRNDFTPAPSMPMPAPPASPSAPYQARDPRLSTRTEASSSHLPSQQPQQQSDEVVIAVIGANGSGKTTFINTVSSSQIRIASGPNPCTNIVQVAPPFTLDGRSVTLIDIPAFDDTIKSNTEILRMITLFLAETYQHGKKIAGVIYIHRISDFRMGGTSTRNFRMFRELCGDSTLKNVIILTNMWGQVGKEVGEARERELASDELFFKAALQKGAQMLRHDNTLESAQAIIKRLLDKNPLVLQIQREIVDEKKDILQTAAGMELNKELLIEMERHRKEMTDLQDEWQAAMNAKDEETRREIEAEAKKLQKEMSRIEQGSRNLANNFQKEKADLAQRLKDVEAEAKRERQRMFRNQMEELEVQRRTDARQSRERMQEEYARQIAGLQRQRSTGGGPFEAFEPDIHSMELLAEMVRHRKDMIKMMDLQDQWQAAMKAKVELEAARREIEARAKTLQNEMNCIEEEYRKLVNNFHSQSGTGPVPELDGRAGNRPPMDQFSMIGRAIDKLFGL